MAKVVSSEAVECPECHASLIVTIWSCGCQRVSGEHNAIEGYTLMHGRGLYPCTCRPFVKDCGEPGENIWGHHVDGETVEPQPEKKKPKIIYDDSEPEPIRIKRIDAVKLAMERYARGEITKEQYNEIMANL